MPLYILYSILALFLLSISIIIFRLTAKYAMPNPKAYFFWYFVIYGLLGLSLPLFNHIQIIPTDIRLLRFNIPYAFFISIGIYCFANAIYKLDVTTMGPLSNLGNVFTAFLAWLLLGEIIPQKNIVWFILIILAGMLATYNERLKLKSFFNKYVYIFLTWVFCLSLTRIIANKGINTIGYWNFTFYELFYFSIVIILVFFPFLLKKIKVGVKPVLFMIPPILFEFLGLLLILKAFSFRVISPAIISSIPLSSIFAFTISRFNKKFLEYHPLKTYLIRFIGIATMTFAVIKLSLG